MLVERDLHDVYPKQGFIVAHELDPPNAQPKIAMIMSVFHGNRKGNLACHLDSSATPELIPRTA
jgi:hypothetical protein